MPRRSSLSRKGRDRLQGRRIFDTGSRRPRSLGSRSPRDERQQVVLPDGSTLNKPESQIYRALTDLGVDFIPQLSLGNRQLGGALIDFALPGYNIAIEYQGPFHNTDEGRARDFNRAVTRRNYQYTQIIEVRIGDLDNIHGFLRRKLGVAV